MEERAQNNLPIPVLRLSVLISKMRIRKPTLVNGNLSVIHSETGIRTYPWRESPKGVGVVTH